MNSTHCVIADSTARGRLVGAARGLDAFPVSFRDYAYFYFTSSSAGDT